MRRIILYISLIMLLTACREHIDELPVSIRKMSDFPVALTSANAFVVDGIVYVWGGRDEHQQRHNEVWAYDEAADSWSIVDRMPMGPRVRQTSCVVGHEVYLGLGFHGQFLIDSAYHQDWWRYRPQSKEWTRLQDYPTQQTMGAIPHYEAPYIYLAYGYRNIEARDVYRYDIGTNQWSHLHDDTPAKDQAFPNRVMGACGASTSGHLYLGTGNDYMSRSFWTEMIPSGNDVQWNRCTGAPGRGRGCATATGTGHLLFVAGGRHWGGTVTNGEVFDNVLCYHIRDDRWTISATLPDGPRENMVAWTKDGKVYFGLGNDKHDKPCSQIYCLEP